MKKDRVLVTGGAGYLGSILVPELLQAGFEVTVLDSFIYGQNSLAHVCSDPHLTLIAGDVRDVRVTEPLLKDADILLPLAALVGAPLCDKDPVGAQTTNHDAPLAMFRLLGREQRVLMPTTNSAYGTSKEGLPLDETSELNPLTLYARDKVTVERALMERENSISFRLATVFGMSPRMRIDLLVNDFVYRAVNDRFVVLFESHFKRNYVHVRDVARAFLHGFREFEKMRGEIYNVGLSDANLSKLELCQLIKEEVRDFYFTESKIGQDPDKRDYVISNAKIEGTGFMPAHSLQSGIRELIKGYVMVNNRKYGNV